jgi:hypothetical protein
MAICLNRCHSLVFLVLLLIGLNVYAQSTSGIPGYIRIPTATLNPDGTVYVGASFLPMEHLAYSKYNYNAGTAFLSVTFLPFLEVDFRFTRMLDYPHYESHVSDRMPSVRARLLKEDKWWPSVVIGVHDFITSLESGAARHFESSYIVVTKGFTLPKTGLSFEGTIGYGTNWLVARNYELLGFWGGMQVKWDRVKWLSLMGDYDGVVTSVGAEAVFFRHLVLKMGTVGFDSYTGCLSYRFRLKK